VITRAEYCHWPWPLFVAGCVPTISDTAAALSAPRAAVAKTMALMVDHEPLLVVTRGDQRVDMHKARSSTADSDVGCSTTHSARVCRDAGSTRRVRGTALCAARTMSTSMQEMHHPAHRASCSRYTASSSSSSRMMTDPVKRQLCNAACLARYTPPVAAAAARRLRLLHMV
jgi:hypothetical protein